MRIKQKSVGFLPTPDSETSWNSSAHVQKFINSCDTVPLTNTYSQTVQQTLRCSIGISVKVRRRKYRGYTSGE
jgi:hypothetical protein